MSVTTNHIAAMSVMAATKHSSELQSYIQVYVSVTEYADLASELADLRLYAEETSLADLGPAADLMFDTVITLMADVVRAHVGGTDDQPF